ncbi:MAG TPA: type II toxin-antitoxin system RelE/ParE family toxin [Thermomicrobiales bacterium]|jgi:proteic killer suppression protein
MMDVTFADDDLDRLETDAAFNMNLPEAIVKAYRKRLQVIRAAPDERDFYQLKSLHYEKLKGQRQHQRSMRLNSQYRLVMEVEGQGTRKVVTIVSIEDYH